MKGFFLLALFLETAALQALPLGTLPQVISGNTQANIDLRSDIWADPSQEKQGPLRRTDGSLLVPFVHTPEWTFSGGLSAESLSLSRTDLVIGEDQIQVGTDLLYQGIQAGVEHRGNQNSWSQILVSYESAGDRPFHAARDVNLDLTVFHSFFAKKRSWVLGVNHSDNRSFLNGKVLPLFGMIYRPYANTELTLGFPFFRLTMTGEESAWDLSALLTPAVLILRLHRRVNQSLQLYLGGNVRAWSYMHSKRTKDDNRLFFQESSVEGGARYPLSKKVFMTNSLGYSFQRKIYESERVYQPTGSRQNLRPDVFVSMKMDFSL